MRYSYDVMCREGREKWYYVGTYVTEKEAESQIEYFKETDARMHLRGPFKYKVVRKKD